MVRYNSSLASDVIEVAPIKSSKTVMVSAEVERRTPAREPNLVGDVLVPFFQALVTSWGIGMATWAVGALLFEMFSWRAALAMGAVVFPFAFITAVGVMRDALFAVELISGVEPGDDEQQLGHRTLRVEVSDPRKMHILNLPVDEEALREFARAALEGRSLGVNEWTGRGRPFTRATYEMVRGEMIRAGLLAWRDERNPQAGVMVTERGREAFAQIAGLPHKALDG